MICYELVDWLIRYPMTAVVTVVFTSCPTRGGQQRNHFILNWDFNAGTTHYRTDRLYSMIGYLSGTEQLDFEANCPVLDD